MALSATRIAAETRKGERSARDTVAGALTQIEAHQERLNTSTLIDSERALERADEIDRAVEAGRDPGPLAGVPVALKDLIDHAGRETTCGSAFYRETPADSATVVTRLEEAGAIIVSRTGLHEFAFGLSSENQFFGPVRNPLDTTLSPGGSSGGSAAAVAAGQAPIAIGTDTGGSVRIPAAMCGVYGLKVTHGRVPLTGVFPLAPSLDTVGPIAAGVEDLSLAYQTLAGFEPSDPWSAPQPVLTSGGPRPDLHGLRVGLPVEWLDRGPVADDVAVAFADAMGAIQSLGATIEEIEDGDLVPSRAFLDILGAEAATIHRSWLEEGLTYGTETQDRLDQAREVDLERYTRANVWRSLVRHRAAAAFSRVDLLATPTVGATRKEIGRDEVNVSSGPLPHRTVLSWFAGLVNVLGCPALTGPLPADHAPPPALQLVAPQWAEHRLLEVAATLENHGVFSGPSGLTD